MLRVVERRGRTKGEHGVRVIFQDQTDNTSKSITVKGMTVGELYAKTLILYDTLAAGYKILIEKDD